ncbi:hypothetical protein [Endozoicomonas numazuensis]|uniref:Uncharacterized protein n=1 Tax=Endozoicomonas numazuensis TaxID=1137799 RepID=A0A081NFR8_9GAMM|nr:hypothetical protein [Endozoicomonas numazuensis]KEQ17291.1 hypothetical protein GZ78_15865 [Endozoicomonas numazuensis]
MRIEDVPVKSDFRALQWELDEVVHNTERKSSSTTYIPYKVPVLPVGYLGILLDLEKCNLEGVYMHDAFVSRVDMAGRKIFWSNPLKTYVLHEDPSVAVDRSDIKHKAHLWQYKLDGPKQLKKLTQEVSLVRGKKPVEYNEVVVGYDKDSIIGVMATLNNTLHDNGISNKEILSDSKNFKSIISDRLNICVPVLRYNCSNGELY